MMTNGRPADGQLCGEAGVRESLPIAKSTLNCRIRLRTTTLDAVREKYCETTKGKSSSRGYWVRI